MVSYITKSANESDKDKTFESLKDAYGEFMKNNDIWCIQVSPNNCWFKSLKGDKKESVLAVLNYQKNPKYRNAKNGDIFWSNEKRYSDDDLKEEPRYKKIREKIEKYVKLSQSTGKTDPLHSEYREILKFLNKQFMDFVEEKTRNRRIFLDIQTNEDFRIFCENKKD